MRSAGDRYSESSTSVPGDRPRADARPAPQGSQGTVPQDELRAAVQHWAGDQSPLGGFNAYYRRLVRLLDEEDQDTLAVLEQAHREALQEVPTLADSINMASYAAASFVEGYLMAQLGRDAVEQTP